MLKNRSSVPVPSLTCPPRLGGTPVCRTGSLLAAIVAWALCSGAWAQGKSHGAAIPADVGSLRGVTAPAAGDGVVTTAMPVDLDGDGFSPPNDCDDTNASIRPGAPEIRDGRDNDCNGVVDDEWDNDGDGWIALYDCDDTNAAIRPGAPELCDGIDNDCDGMIDGPCALGGDCYDPANCDQDADGWVDADDCRPDDPTVYPFAVEWCDGVDNNCDGLVDGDCLEDCDGNLIADLLQISANPTLDLDANGRIDACEILDDPSLDCNGNFLLDAIELSDPITASQIDCDQNGAIDGCEIVQEPGLDCDASGTLDTCDLASGLAEDCDGNLVPDTCEQSGRVLAFSPTMSPFGFTSPQTWTLPNAAPTLAGPFDTVSLSMRIRGDFAGAGEYLSVHLNGRFAGHVPGQGPYDCSPDGAMGSDRFMRILQVPGNLWNYAIEFGNGTLNIEFRPSIAVDTDRCPAPQVSFITAAVEYTSTLSADCNENGLLDVCEVVIAPWIDLNLNGVPDECDGTAAPAGCPGDADGSGSVDAADISLLLLAYGSPAVPGDPLDTDLSGLIDAGDISTILLTFGPCP